MKKLTTVSYALLGYIAFTPLSAYELTKLMRFSGARFLWPRTESRLYKEPKNLVDHGLATATVRHNGKRARTVYAITDEGRESLAAWLGTPGAGLRIEDEALLKVFYANFGSKQQLLDQLGVMRDQLREEYLGMIAAFETEVHPFPERIHLSRLVVEHRLLLLDARARWLVESERRVRDWNSTHVTPGERTATAEWRWQALSDTRDALARFDRARPSP